MTTAPTPALRTFINVRFRLVQETLEHVVRTGIVLKRVSQTATQCQVISKGKEHLVKSLHAVIHILAHALLVQNLVKLN